MIILNGKNLDSRADLCVTGSAQFTGGELIHKEHDSWDAVVKKLESGDTITQAWANEWIPKPYNSMYKVKEQLDTLIKRFAWVETYVTNFNTENGWVKLKKYYETH